MIKLHTITTDATELWNIIQLQSRVKWSDLYKSEQDIIKDLMQVDYETGMIAGLKNYYLKNNTLSNKQMVQLKRLSKEIVKNILIRNEQL